MKHTIAAIGITVSFLTSCVTRKSQENSAPDWREMDVLATTMERAFQPLKDSSTVGAATRLMAQIADESGRLATSTLPGKVNNEIIKKKIEKLKTDTQALANEIATGTEEDVIGTDFYKIHDLYQEIHDAWKK
jgi:hypothetical protein